MELLLLVTVVCVLGGLYGLYATITAISFSAKIECFFYVLIIFAIPTVMWFLYIKGLEVTRNDPARRRQIEEERQAAIRGQKNDSPWETKYYTHPCPFCEHYKVRPAKWEDKQISVAFWGIASPKIGDTYKCDHCGKTWS